MLSILLSILIGIPGHILAYIQTQRLKQLQEKFDRVKVALEAVEREVAGGGAYHHYDIEKNQWVYII